MKNLSVRWQKLIVWLTGYLNIIAFVIAGGYLFEKTEHQEVKNSAKTAFIVTAVFTAADMVHLIIYYCYNLASNSARWLSTFSWVISLVKIVVFVLLFIVDITVGIGSGNGKKTSETKETKAEEETKEI